MGNYNFKANRAGLKTYLGQQGIDAMTVLEDSVTPEGYMQFVLNEDGSPRYGTKNGSYQIERVTRQWPSEEVYLNVAKLLLGAKLEDLEPKKTKPKKEAAE